MDPYLIVTMTLAYEIEDAMSRLAPGTQVREEDLPCRLRFAEAALYLDTMVRYGGLTVDEKGNYFTPAAPAPDAA